jgi:molybdate transport system substrate-binding protein
MVRTFITLLAVALLSTACGKNKQPHITGEGKTLTVLCGAGIRPAMEPIKTAFEAESDCTVKVMYAGSGTLLGQIQAGVEADLYLPGDISFIRKAQAKNLVADHRVLAWFVPVIAVQKGNPKSIRNLNDLARDDVAVGMGKADACAIGNITRDLLSAANISNPVKADFEAMTVNRLANQIQLKALDAAIIWDATAAQYPNAIDVVPLEDGNTHAVPMAIGMIAKSQQTKLANRFMEFAAGDVGATHFRKNQYQVPGNALRLGCGSSFRPAVEDLAKLFEEETGCKTLRNYGGSGTVLLQIEESKEGDIYVCHDPFAYLCEDKGISENWHTIATIEPTIAVLKDNPKNVKGFKDLLREDLSLGLPHRDRSTRGKILWTLLKKHGMSETMEQRKFFESRTHDLINQLTLKTIDIAVLWDAPVNAMPEFKAIPIEEKFKVDAVTSATSGRTYSIRQVKVTVVRLNFSKEPLLAAQFAKICQTKAGRSILKKHCFALPEMP